MFTSYYIALSVLLLQLLLAYLLLFYLLAVSIFLTVSYVLAMQLIRNILNKYCTVMLKLILITLSVAHIQCKVTFFSISLDITEKLLHQLTFSLIWRKKINYHTHDPDVFAEWNTIAVWYLPER
jgi:hypothetical protein